MSPDGFRRIALPKPGPQAPCLLRGVFYAGGISTDPFGLLGTHAQADPSRALRTYPNLVLYGGPTIYSATQTPMWKEFIRGLGYWALVTTKTWLATELVFISPSRFPVGEPAWPHTEWRWWYRKETKPEVCYQLTQLAPNQYAWAPAPGESWYQA